MNCEWKMYVSFKMSTFLPCNVTKWEKCKISTTMFDTPARISISTARYMCMCIGAITRCLRFRNVIQQLVRIKTNPPPATA